MRHTGGIQSRPVGVIWVWRISRPCDAHGGFRRSPSRYQPPRSRCCWLRDISVGSDRVTGESMEATPGVEERIPSILVASMPGIIGPTRDSVKSHVTNENAPVSRGVPSNDAGR